MDEIEYRGYRIANVSEEFVRDAKAGIDEHIARTVESAAEPPEPLVDEQARDEMQRAMAQLLRSGVDPLQVAAENERLRSAIKGTHALLHALVARYVGVNVSTVITRAEHETPDLAQELIVDLDRSTHDVTLLLRTKSRAERRAEAKARN
jgi:hypothetical protein